MHTAIVTAPDFDLDFRKAEHNGNRVDLEIHLRGQVPTLRSMHAVYGNQRVVLTRSGNVLRPAGESPLEQLCQSHNQYGYNPYQQRNTSDPATIYTSAELPLVTRNVWLASETRNNNELRLPDGFVRVFLFADMPAEFLEVEGGPEKRQGRMLYVFDHPLDK